jgi:hypothetical protein
VAPDFLRRPLLAVTLLLAACGGGKKSAEPEAAVDMTAIRAHRDSLRMADSVARVTFTTCSDSVIQAMGKTAAGKKKLAVKPPEGMIRPEVLTACGKPPAAPVTAPAPSGTAQAAPTQANPSLTPQQLAVQRADSIRKAKEQAKADSLKAKTEMAAQDSLRRAKSDSVRSDSLQQARETEVLRETFTYAGGSRDPFVSLISTAKVGPEFSDLVLVGVYLDLRHASNSVAVLHDKNSGKRYKLRVGDQVGRLKVAQIRQQDVVFTVEDIGFERQETLSMRKREEDTP